MKSFPEPFEQIIKPEEGDMATHDCSPSGQKCGKLGLAIGSERGGSLVELSPLSCGVCANSGRLMPELNQIAGQPVCVHRDPEN